MKKILILAITAFASIGALQAQEIENEVQEVDITTFQQEEPAPLVPEKLHKKMKRGWLFNIGASMPMESIDGFDKAPGLELEASYLMHFGHKTPSSPAGTGPFGVRFGLSYKGVCWKEQEDGYSYYNDNRTYHSLSYFALANYYLTSRFILSGGFSINYLISSEYEYSDDIIDLKFCVGLHAGINYLTKSGFVCGVHYEYPLGDYGAQNVYATIGWFFEVGK